MRLILDSNQRPTCEVDSRVSDSECLGAQVVISQMPARREPLQIDEHMWKWRQLNETFFGKLKEFKRIAMRSDKTDSSFRATIYVASAVNNSR